MAAKLGRVTRPREHAYVLCVGCGLEFSSSEAFDLHSTGKRRSPLGAPKRCRTEAEMHALGMVCWAGAGHRRWSLRGKTR